jgi:integrase
MANIQKRVNGSGKVTYRVQVRRKGQPAQTATFERLTDAKKWAHTAEAAAIEGRHFKHGEAKRHTLADLAERYCRDVLPHKRPETREKRTAQLKVWSEALGAYTLADITPAMLAELRDRLLSEGRSGPTVNRYLAALSHAFTVAEKEWGWVEHNPLRKVTKYKENGGRLRYLSRDEMTRLLDACKASETSELYPAVLLALSTGMRRGELFGLTWDRVDLKAGRITLDHTKNGERRNVPLQGEALTAVRELPRHLDTPLLFPSRVHRGTSYRPLDLRTPWETALKRADIRDFRFHDLRHTAASYLAMSGADMLTIAAVLGHKTLQMVKRYAHLSDQHQADALARMNAALFG